MDRTYISDCSTIGTVGNCVAMYRIKNKAIDTKNIADVSNSLNFRASLYYNLKDSDLVLYLHKTCSFDNIFVDI